MTVPPVAGVHPGAPGPSRAAPSSAELTRPSREGLVAAVVAIGAVLVVAMWWHDNPPASVQGFGPWLTSAGRPTGLVGPTWWWSRSCSWGGWPGWIDSSAWTAWLLSAQNLHIDVVSGATYTSDAFAQTLQAALRKAGR